ncbi:MAG: hypothetical protein CFE45_24475 [Burkholderiales bacterium PBB5]|nr:MAG: hypothetical protein CFE45_24475 [Burkholderiales bacterium PBB5]
MPAAYILAEVTITDADQMAVYREWSSKAMAEHGATVLVRGGTCTTLEGGWAPQRLVVLQFPSREVAQTFYDSPTYTHARALRANAGHLRMVLVDGVA